MARAQAGKRASGQEGKRARGQAGKRASGQEEQEGKRARGARGQEGKRARGQEGKKVSRREGRGHIKKLTLKYRPFPLEFSRSKALFFCKNATKNGNFNAQGLQEYEPNLQTCAV
jgi:hypothetical protein